MSFERLLHNTPPYIVDIAEGPQIRGQVASLHRWDRVVEVGCRDGERVPAPDEHAHRVDGDTAAMSQDSHLGKELRIYRGRVSVSTGIYPSSQHPASPQAPDAVVGG